MVNRSRRTVSASVVAGILSGSPAAWGQASGPSVLEQMQTEVASIANTARPAVVAIEDARGVITNYVNSPLRKSELQDKLTHLQIDKKALDAEVTAAEARYKAGLTTVVAFQELRRKLALVDVQITAQQKRIDLIGHEDPTTLQKQELDAKISEAEINQKFYGELARLLQEQANAGMIPPSNTQDAKRQLASAEQNMLNFQRQRKDLERVPPPAPRRLSAPKSGSGFSIGDGYIVTTADVVDGMSNPIVTTDDGRQIRARLVGSDTELNVGVVRLLAFVDMPALKMGDSSTVQPGHFAISIGNQTGQNNSVSFALVSGIRTQGLYSGAHFYPALLQLDGSVGAGTSGAPIMNARGEVIGMLAAVLAEPLQTASYLSMPTLQGNLDSSSSLGMAFYTSGQGNASAPANGITLPTLETPPAAPVDRMATNTQAGQITSQQRFRSATNKRGSSTRSTEKKTPDRTLPLNADTAHTRGVDPSGMGDRSTANATRTNGRGQSASLPFVGQSPGQAEKTVPSRQLGNGNAFQTPTPPLPNYSGYGGFDGNAVPKNGGVAANGVGFWRPANLQSNGGFAIPINQLKVVVEQLRNGKDVTHAWLGVDLENVENAREANGILQIERQVRVRGVYANSPAVRVGFKPGDVLMTLDNKPVHTTAEVRLSVITGKVGDRILVGLQRKSKPLTLELTTEARPANPQLLLSVTVVKPPEPAPK